MNLKTIILNTIVNYIDQQAPHLKRPAAMYARITRAAQISEDSWQYSIKLLRDDYRDDSIYPEIPGIKSKLEIGSGKMVAVVLMGGQLKPFIVGEVLL